MNHWHMNDQSRTNTSDTTTDYTDTITHTDTDICELSIAQHTTTDYTTDIYTNGQESNLKRNRDRLQRRGAKLGFASFSKEGRRQA